MQGEAGESASGRAIMASQQGGMIEMGDLLDNLRHFDKRVYRMVWNRIRQYWTGQKWIRITDDERNIRFAAINKPATIQLPVAGPDGQPIEVPDIDPMTGRQRIQNNIAQSEVDIYIDDVSDVVAPQIEQWQALVELKKVDVNNEISFEDLIQAAPNIRNKDQILERMQQRKQEAAQQPQPPSPEEQKLALQAQQMQMQAQARAQEQQQKLAFEQEAHRQEMAMKAQEHGQEMQIAAHSARIDEMSEMRKAQMQEAQAGQKMRLQSMAGEAKVRLANQPPQQSGGDVTARLERQFAAMAQAMQQLGATIKAVDDGNRQHRDTVTRELVRLRQARAKKPAEKGPKP
jgi:hypothetical protein